MGGLIYKVLDLFSNNFIRQILTSLGIGIVTGLPFYLMLSTYIYKAASHIESTPYIGLMAVFGIPEGFGIIFTAIMTRAYWESMRPRLAKRS
ncbi:DUF2523 family protein [Acinetobacter sp. FL]|uniref:DUF2523 family protein n=1 Tax=Acinetobacter sp. FL TaxID=3231720 RepID=UPI00345B97C6